MLCFAYTAMKLDREPFKDARVRRLALASSWKGPTFGHRGVARQHDIPTALRALTTMSIAPSLPAIRWLAVPGPRHAVGSVKGWLIAGCPGQGPASPVPGPGRTPA